jgi:hypothetical protein
MIYTQRGRHLPDNMVSKKVQSIALLPPLPDNMVSKNVQRKIWLEEWRKRNEEEEKRRNKIREKVKKSRGAAETRRKAGEKWWEEIGKPKWQFGQWSRHPVQCGDTL